jgi:hypothetical protein
MVDDPSENGSSMKQITFGSEEDDTPVWSPDGRRIAFVSIRKGRFADLRHEPGRIVGEAGHPWHVEQHPSCLVPSRLTHPLQYPSLRTRKQGGKGERQRAETDRRAPVTRPGVKPLGRSFAMEWSEGMIGLIQHDWEVWGEVARSSEGDTP